jgi:hypothetical protein
MHTLFLREHNRLADEVLSTRSGSLGPRMSVCAACADARPQLQAANPSWSDEQVFRQARMLTIAVWQNILIYEFTLNFGNEADSYFYTELVKLAQSGYHPGLDPTVPLGWDAVYRMHSALRDVTLMDRCRAPLATVRLADMFYAPGVFRAAPLEAVLMGLANTPANALGLHTDEQLRNVSAGGRTVFDLTATDVFRARDMGAGARLGA